MAIDDIKFYRTEVAGRKPATVNIKEGEIALNLTDKVIFSKNSNDEIIELGANLENKEHIELSKNMAARNIFNFKSIDDNWISVPGLNIVKGDTIELDFIASGIEYSYWAIFSNADGSYKLSAVPVNNNTALMFRHFGNINCYIDDMEIDSGGFHVPMDGRIHHLKITFQATPTLPIDRFGRREDGSATYIDFPLLNIDIKSSNATSNRFYPIDDGYNATGIIKDKLGNSNAILHNATPSSWGVYKESGIIFNSEWTDNEGSDQGDLVNRAGVISTPDGVLVFHHEYDPYKSDLNLEPTVTFSNDAIMSKVPVFEHGSRVWAASNMRHPTVWMCSGLNGTTEVTKGNAVYLNYLTAEYNKYINTGVLVDYTDESRTTIRSDINGVIKLNISLKFWSDNNIDDNVVFRLEMMNVSDGIWNPVSYAAGYINNDDGEVTDILFEFITRANTGTQFRVIYDEGSSGLRQAGVTISACAFGIF